MMSISQNDRLNNALEAQRLRTILGLAFRVALIVVGVALYLFVRVIYQDHDLDGCYPVDRIGIVTQTVPSVMTANQLAPFVNITIAVSGNYMFTKTFAPVRIGEKVDVNYTVGKSGRAYLNSFVLLPMHK